MATLSSTMSVCDDEMVMWLHCAGPCQFVTMRWLCGYTVIDHVSL